MAELAKSIDRSIEAQNKRAKMFADEERERHAAYLKFKEEEGKRNRKHDLEIVKIYAEAMHSSTVRVPQGMPLREETIHVPQVYHNNQRTSQSTDYIPRHLNYSSPPWQ